MSISDIKDRALGACYDVFKFLCSPAGALFIAAGIAATFNSCESSKTQAGEKDKTPSVQHESSKIASKPIQKVAFKTNQIHGMQR